MDEHDQIEDPSDPAGSASAESDQPTEPDAAPSSAVITQTAPKAHVTSPAKGKVPNNVRRHRIERMMSKAELARRANLSVLTIDRVEKGFGCRMDSKRKILEALGLSLA